MASEVATDLDVLALGLVRGVAEDPDLCFETVRVLSRGDLLDLTASLSGMCRQMVDRWLDDRSCGDPACEACPPVMPFDEWCDGLLGVMNGDVV